MQMQFTQSFITTSQRLQTTSNVFQVHTPPGVRALLIEEQSGEEIHGRRIPTNLQLLRATSFCPVHSGTKNQFG